MVLEHVEFCRKLQARGVDPTLAVRGFIPYTKYQSGETVSYRAICWRETLNVDEEGKVKGRPTPERYYAKLRRKPIFAEIRGKEDIAHIEPLPDGGQAILARVEFRQDKRHKFSREPQWTVLTVTTTQNHGEARGDNIHLILPQGTGKLGTHEDGTPDPNAVVRFFSVDE